MLAGTKLIAEAWDAVGLYQLGSFVGHRWTEWNAEFRDDVRRFVKSDVGTARRLALRMAGSPDLFPDPDRDPNRSINFVTSHDGFTLNDLVSYNVKHNEANGEDNRDGTDVNFSWNCGAEGETDDPAIEALRLRQIKNLLTILLISQGTPMLLMGDEVRRTQRGNNNAYCQNNEISWFDWNGPERHAGLLRFVRALIHFTLDHDVFQEERFWTDTAEERPPHITWHGVKVGQPDWSYDAHSLAFTLHYPEMGNHLHVLLNAYWEALPFNLPALSSGLCWHRIVDTALDTPDDFCEPGAAPPVETNQYRAEARSAVVLLAQPKAGPSPPLEAARPRIDVAGREGRP